MKKQKTSDVEKMFFIYESMILMEKKKGKYLNIKELEDKVVSTRNLNKSNNLSIRISRREFNKLLNYFIFFHE